MYSHIGDFNFEGKISLNSNLRVPWNLGTHGFYNLIKIGVIYKSIGIDLVI